MGLVALLAFLATKGLARSRVTTALLLFAVTAGVGLQVPNTANLRGYTANLFDEATTRGFGDVRVYATKDSLIDDGDAVASELGAIAGVRGAVPIVSLAGAIESARGQQHVSEVHGVDPHAPFVPYRVRAGVDLADDDEDGVLVGTALAVKLGIAPGDTVRVRILYPGPSDVETYGSSANVAEYMMKVRGTAAGTFGAYQSLFVRRALLVRAMARAHAASRVLLYLGSELGSAGVSTTRREAPRVAERLALDVAHRPGLRASTWMTETPYADSAIRANETLGIVSHTMVVIAVTIPIAALLFVAVESRRREIAMLAALGFRRGEIFVAFILQAVVVGVVGGVLGCIVGWLAVRAFEAHPIFESADFVVRPVATASAFYEPALVVLIATAIAAAYPAYRATKIDPARVLRGLA